MGLIWIDIFNMVLTYKLTIHVYANIPILSHPMDPMGRQERQHRHHTLEYSAVEVEVASKPTQLGQLEQ